MPKLNQIVALEKGLKGRTEKAVTAIYHTLQKGALFNGFNRVYSPKDEEGEQYPPEGTHIQEKVTGQLALFSSHMVQLFDVVATKDWGNTKATADVTVDGRVIVSGAPVTYLLFLEKELIHWRTALGQVPVLDPAEVWVYDQDNAWYRTEPSRSIKTKKIPRVLELSAATDRHPAQVQTYNEDVPVGYWDATKFSSAIPARRRDELIARVDMLIDAVKAAREEANGIEIDQVKVGENVFSYLLA